VVSAPGRAGRVPVRLARGSLAVSDRTVKNRWVDGRAVAPTATRRWRRVPRCPPVSPCRPRAPGGPSPAPTIPLRPRAACRRGALPPPASAA